MKSFRINNTKIANSIRKNDDLPGFRLSLTVNQRGAKKKIKTLFVITEDLSYFEMAVADAIYSLYLDGTKKFTPRKVLAVLSGDNNISVSRDRKQKMEDCIDKLIDTEIYISCAAEAKITSSLQSRYGGAFLSAVKEKNGYRFSSEEPMPLYSYGEAKRHIITVPCLLLEYLPLDGREQDDRIDNRDENILLKQYLIHELELVRNANNSVPEMTVSLKGKKSIPLLEALGINSDSYTDDAYANKVRDVYRKTALLLEYWKRIGYLNAYEEDKMEYCFHITQEMLCLNPSHLYRS